MMPEPQPTRRPRQGPRPLGLHLLAAHGAWMSSLAALPLLRTGSHDWSPDEPLQALLAELAGYPDEDVDRAVLRAVYGRAEAFLDGILRYRRHPYRRDLPDPPALLTEGGSRLLDYGGPDAPGPAVLFVPSLVNRAYILDLSRQRSFLRWLAGQGFRPLLIDWGWPDEAARGFTLGDYILGRGSRFLAAACEAAGGPVPVVGYCMGGTLAVALAQRRAAQVAGLVLLATPWDFHAGAAASAHLQAAMLDALEPILSFWGELPVDVLQTFFAGLDPLLGFKKFARFAQGDAETPQAEAFVALEDWLNDGIPLAGPVAAECIRGWYVDNAPARGEWTVGGEPVDPAQVTQPSLHLIPSNDRIVPPASSRALAAAMPEVEVIDPPLGHIGMMVGGAAPKAVWRPVADWLAAHA
jgi:polyhydroxyalkanoate synthase